MKNEQINDSTPGVVPWPKPISETGRYGIAGEFVSLVEPHTEADPNAILITFLTYAGNCMGRFFYVTAGADQHCGNLFTCIVGPTGHGRKGSAMSAVQAFYTYGNPPTLGHKLKGISTGEAIVYEIHDAIYKYQLVKGKNGVQDSYANMLAEPNVADKRLFIQLSEFQQALANMRKPDSILPSILRTAWDHGDLATPAKTSRATATGAHVSLLTAMSPEELLKDTDETDADSGLLNRFLLCCSRMSKRLPQGGKFQSLYKSQEWKHLQERLARNIETFEEQVCMEFDIEAQNVWGFNDQPEFGIYKDLNEPRVGMWGAITARAPQMVLRLAMITAAVNGQRIIGMDALSAAKEIWRYCDDSCKHIFGDKLDDQTTADIMQALRAIEPAALSRSQIYRIWNGKKPRAEIDRALLWISKTGIGRMESQKTAGRPIELWYSC